MAVPKSNKTRVGRLVTDLIEYIVFGYQYTIMSQHQKGVAGMLHYISNQQTYPSFLTLILV